MTISPAASSHVDRQCASPELLGVPRGPGFRRLRPAIVHTRNIAALETTPAAWAARSPARLHGEHGRDAVDPDGRNLRRQRIRRLYKPFVTRYVALSQPYADSSAIPTYRVCQLARRHVTVALSGDESFAGYRRYRLHLAEERLRRALPQSVRVPVFGALGRAYPKADWAPRFLRAKTTFEALGRDAVAAYFHSVSILRDDMRSRLFSGRFKAELGGYNAIELFRRHAADAQTDDPLALIQYLDLKTYLVGDINTKVDRASMAHSLEVREPLMDHPLVEWLASLPSSLKVHSGEGKWLLKKAMKPRLPQQVLYRPKMGFAVPLARWFRGPLRQRVRDALTEGRLVETGIFEPTCLRRLVDDHQSGVRDYSAPLWTLLMFDAFLRNVVEAGVAKSALGRAA